MLVSGGTQLLMGVDSVVMCMFEFTSFFFVDHVIRRVGHMGIMYIGLLGYAVRFLVYASITNPWLVLPADALQGSGDSLNSFIHSFILKTYTAPLQKTTTERHSQPS